MFAQKTTISKPSQCQLTETCQPNQALFSSRIALIIAPLHNSTPRSANDNLIDMSQQKRLKHCKAENNRRPIRGRIHPQNQDSISQKSRSPNHVAAVFHSATTRLRDGSLSCSDTLFE